MTRRTWAHGRRSRTTRPGRSTQRPTRCLGRPPCGPLAPRGARWSSLTRDDGSGARPRGAAGSRITPPAAPPRRGRPSPPPARRPPTPGRPPRRRAGSTAPMCGRTSPDARSPHSSSSLRTSSSGRCSAKSRNWKPSTAHPFNSTRLSGIRGDHPRGVADGHEATAPVERPERRLGQVAADRVHHHVGAAGEHRLQRGPQVDAGVLRPGGWRRPPRAAASLAGDEATAVTVAPRWWPSATAASPTPPPAPRTISSSPACRRATERSTWYAVRQATPKAAAWRSSTPGGTTRTRRRRPRPPARRRRRPARCPPPGRRPDSPSTPSATSSTTPTNSLPGTKGGGTVIWYRSATSSTSGKLTAAARTRTRTWPAPSSGAGTSSTVTTSGPAVGAADGGPHVSGPSTPGRASPCRPGRPPWRPRWRRPPTTSGPGARGRPPGPRR